MHNLCEFRPHQQRSAAVKLAKCVYGIYRQEHVFFQSKHIPDHLYPSIIQTQSYFISSATDNKILIWDKYSGTLVHSITQVSRIMSMFLRTFLSNKYFIFSSCYYIQTNKKYMYAAPFHVQRHGTFSSKCTCDSERRLFDFI